MLLPLLPWLFPLVPPSAPAGSDWTDLDAAIQELTAPNGQAAHSGPLLSGFVRVNYADSDDIDFMGDDDPDHLGGFNLDAARLQISGDWQGWGYFLGVDGFSQTVTLMDAYITIPCTDSISAVVGQFKTPFLRTGLMDEDRLLFIAHTRNGIFYSIRDRGAEARIDQGAFHGQLAAQNGSDGIQDDLLLTARATLEVNGDAKTGRKVEGAFGAPQELCAEFGVAISDDGAVDDGDVVALEGAATFARFYFQAEVLAYGESFDLDGAGAPIPGSRSDTDPFSLTASYMLSPERWELALRYEDFDDDLNRVLTTAGVNYYLQGLDVKFQVNAFHLDSDGGDEDTLAGGATISF
jgi:hypothetical protein